jgi:hypothetical protein
MPPRFFPIKPEFISATRGNAPPAMEIPMKRFLIPELIFVPIWIGLFILIWMALP